MVLGGIGKRPVAPKAKKTKEQVCSEEQAKIDQKLDKRAKKGFESLSRKQLQAIAKKYEVNTFQKKTAEIISALREIAKNKE